MNTFIARGSVALAALCLFGAAVQAQSYQAGATIPFSFHAGGQALPAGRYDFARYNNLAVAKVASAHGGTIFVSTSVGSENTSHRNGVIVFRSYGDVRFLAEVWDLSGNGAKLPIGKREKEYRVGSKQVASVIVAVPVRAD